MTFNAHSLGEYDQGVHKHYMGIAMFDLIGSIVIAWLIAGYFDLNVVLVMLIVLILGEIAHVYFNVKTEFTKTFGLYKQ